MTPQRIYFGIAARRFKGRTFGEQTSYVRGLLRLGKSRGMTSYVFTPAGVDFYAGRVWGYYLGKKGWQRKNYPLPHVVYDRVWGLTEKEQSRFESTLLRFHERGIPVFNPDFGDKWDVHNLLSSQPELLGHLPMTRVFDEESLSAMSEIYSDLYLKPSRGRQGKGISRCRLTKDGYQLITRLESGRVARRILKTARSVADFVGNNPVRGRLLVQQGLDLHRVRGSCLDIRAIVQRDGKGQWRVSGIGVRVGAAGGFVSNLHAGGRALPLEKALRGKSTPIPVGELKSQVRKLSLATAKQMSRLHPTLGELGVDIGLDKNGHLWILEVNRQPGRALFARARLRRSWKTSRVRIVQFAKHLAIHGLNEKEGTESYS